MSRGGRLAQVSDLRQTIARIEGNGRPQADGRLAGTDRPGEARRVSLGRQPAGGFPAEAGECGRQHAAGPLGGCALDGALGGGLGRGSLTEVVAHRAGDAGAASGLALALAARFAKAGRGAVVWVLEDGAQSETGAPYAPGLAAHGLDPGRLVVVRTASGTDALWALEEALKCRAVAAAVLELWRTKTYDLVASRRLVLAAGSSGTPGIVVAAGAPGTVHALSSAAQTRLEVKARRSQPIAMGARVPLPGSAAWSVRLARIRAGPAGLPTGIDCEKFWPLVWDHHQAWFCDAISVPPPALPAHRSHPAERRGEDAAAA